MKANSIGDAAMIEALYEASRAGVRIDLVIRGISCLRAGVEGLSENIHVRSILGRYLEHSRIYRFRHGDVDDTPLYLIGSADIMPRNLDRRVEVLVPIEHPKHRDWLDHVLDFLLADDIVRWELRPTTRGNGSARPTPSSRTPRSACTAGSSSARPRPASSPSRAARIGRRPIGTSPRRRRSFTCRSPSTGARRHLRFLRSRPEPPRGSTLTRLQYAHERSSTA